MEKAREELTFHIHVGKWPDKEAEVKNSITNTKDRISMPTKIIIFEARRRVVTDISDIAGAATWCYRFMNRHGQ